MRRILGLLGITAAILLTTEYAYAQGVGSSITITKVDVKNLGAGKGFDVTATASMTLATKAKMVTYQTFYFRDPNNNTVPASVSAGTPPAPGKTVTITFKPYNNPVFLQGTWIAYGQFNDDLGNNPTHNKTFTVP